MLYRKNHSIIDGWICTNQTLLIVLMTATMAWRREGQFDVVVPHSSWQGSWFKYKDTPSTESQTLTKVFSLLIKALSST